MTSKKDVGPNSIANAYIKLRTGKVKVAEAAFKNAQKFWPSTDAVRWYLRKNNLTTADLRGSGDAELETQLDEIDDGVRHFETKSGGAVTMTREDIVELLTPKPE